MAWTGTERQIAWAKDIKAQAEPVIAEWRSYMITRSSRLQQRTSRFDTYRSGRLRDQLHEIHVLNDGLRIEDARFWIDLRECPDAQTFIAAVQTWRERHPHVS